MYNLDFVFIHSFLFSFSFSFPTSLFCVMLAWWMCAWLFLLVFFLNEIFSFNRVQWKHTPETCFSFDFVHAFYCGGAQICQKRFLKLYFTFMQNMFCEQHELGDCLTVPEFQLDYLFYIFFFFFTEMLCKSITWKHQLKRSVGCRG